MTGMEGNSRKLFQERTITEHYGGRSNEATRSKRNTDSKLSSGI